MGPLSPGAYPPQHCFHAEKRVSKALLSTESCQGDSPEHPSMQTLLGFPDLEILKVAEQVYRGESVLLPNILPHRQQDECMRELHQELTKHMASPGLQGETGLARPTARGRRYSCSCSTSQACSLSAGPQGVDLAKLPRKDDRMVG